MDDKWKITVAPDSQLTKAQIEAMVAKLSANGLGPGARVFDIETGELTSREQLLEKLDR